MLEAFDLYSPEIDADPFPCYELAMKRFLEREYDLTTRKIAWNSSSNFRSPVALPFATR
jgi:hypothetical protein